MIYKSKHSIKLLIDFNDDCCELKKTKNASLSGRSVKKSYRLNEVSEKTRKWRDRT